MRSTSLALMRLVAAHLALTGCAVGLRTDPLDEPYRTHRDRIGLEEPVNGLNGKVGWGRFTVFYIPVVPIYVMGGGNEAVAEQIRLALERVGYDVSFGTADQLGDLPRIRVHVDRFWFNNYTWFFPIVPTWGSIELRLELVAQDGTTVWSRSFASSGDSLNFTNGFSAAANEAMEPIRKDLVAEFASKEFHAILVEHSAAREIDGEEPQE